MKRAAVSLVENRRGLVLCVWNQRYKGWSLPGGMVEEGETVEQAQARELREETGLKTISAVQIFEGLTKQGLPNRASHVHVFKVQALGTAKQTEDGCPVAWMTREAFLLTSPFAEFYRGVL